MKVKEYTIYLRGLDGKYGIGLKAIDILGNTTEVLFSDRALSLVDAEAAIVSVTCEPKITKTTTTARVKFNVPVVVLPSAPIELSTMSLMADPEREGLVSPASMDADENYVTEYSLVCYGPEEVTLYVMDECGRTYELTFTPDATFIEGFKISAYIEKNGEIIENGGFISFNPEDTMYYIVTPYPEYQDQYFILDDAEYSGLKLNEELSETKIIYDEEESELIYEGQIEEGVLGEEMDENIDETGGQASEELEEVDKEEIGEK